MSGHTGDSVVENNRYGVALIIDYIKERSHTAVEEGGVAENAYCSLCFIAFSVEDLLETVSRGNGRAHTVIEVHSVVGSREGEGITTYIARNHDVLAVAEGIEKTSVRAARAKSGRTRDDLIGIGLHTLVSFAGNGFSEDVRGKFSVGREEIVALAVITEESDRVFNEAVVFFDDVDSFESFAEVVDFLHRLRISKAELKIVDSIAKNFLRVIVAHTRSYNAGLAAVIHDEVEGSCFCEFFFGFEMLFDLVSSYDCVGGNVHVFLAFLT